MPDHPQKSAIYRVSELSPRKAERFELLPDADQLRAIAADLGLQDLRKLRFSGALAAEGRKDWRLDAHLGATVVQPCVATLAPVTTRIEEDITRRFLKDWPPAEEIGDEVEMPEDDTIDPLEAEIDLMAILQEALSLALPAYPRATGAEADHTAAAPPGVTPMTDEDTKPFAGLADLKKKLEGKND